MPKPALGAVYAEMGELLAQVRRPADSPLSVAKPADGLFDETQRASWKKSDAARCDFSSSPLMARAGGVRFIARWRHTVVGRTLGDIKGDDAMVPFFADAMAPLIQETLGQNLGTGGWALVTTPRRRHKERNFATLVSAQLAARLGIPFHEDVCTAKSAQRINAQFSLRYMPPEPNIIVFDDFVTTGSTIHSMQQLFQPLGKNLIFFTAVNNNI